MMAYLINMYKTHANEIMGDFPCKRRQVQLRTWKARIACMSSFCIHVMGFNEQYNALMRMAEATVKGERGKVGGEGGVGGFICELY